MSEGKKCSMGRRIIHRSHKCLVVDYDDGERAVVRDVERIRWILTECDSMVREGLIILKLWLLVMHY